MGRLYTALCHITFALLLHTGVCDGVQWSQTPADQGVVYGCSGQDLTLRWNFTLAPGEKVEDIKWFYTDGRSQQMIAISSDGTFVVTPTFSGRVSLHGNAGLELDHVVPEDKGNYSVDVDLHHLSAGTFSKVHHTAMVDIAAPPSTSIGNLTLTQSRTAVYNNDTGTWHVQLACGHFTDLGQPPVNVDWKTPASVSKSSTQYEDGRFFLLLDNPVVGGQYSCQLSRDSPAASSCFHGNDPMSRAVTVNVDETKARLTLIEANQVAQQVENAELTKQLEQYQDTNVKLTRQLGNLTDLVHRLETQLLVYHEQTSHNVYFYARLSSTQVVNSPNPVIPDYVYINKGGAYSPTTGQFTVPVNGTYVFVATVGTHTTGTHAAVYMTVDSNSDEVCYTFSIHTDNSQSSSCQAVVYLVKGQRVWLRSVGTSHYWFRQTSFSGFLLSQDE